MADEAKNMREQAGAPEVSDEGPSAPDGPKTSILTDNFIARFLKGFWYPFRGFRFVLGNLSLLKFCILPIIINIVIFVLILVLSNYFWATFVGGWQPAQQAWYWEILFKIARVLAYIVGFLVFCILCGFTFATVGTLMAAPFLDFLSQRVEETALRKSREVPFSLKLMLTDLRIVLMGTFIRLGICASVLILLLPLLLVPGGQIIYLGISTLFAVWFVALEFVDYSMSRARIGFWQKSRFAWRFRSTMLGFGSAVYITLLIPVIGFFCLPISTVGGTLLFLDMAERHPELLRLPALPPAENEKGRGKNEDAVRPENPPPSASSTTT